MWELLCWLQFSWADGDTPQASQGCAFHAESIWIGPSHWESRHTAHATRLPEIFSVLSWKHRFFSPKSFNKLLSSGTDNQHINMDTYFPSSAALSLSFVLIWACDLHGESLKAHQMWCGLAPFSSLHKQFRTPRKVFFYFLFFFESLSTFHWVTAEVNRRNGLLTL